MDKCSKVAQQNTLELIMIEQRTWAGREDEDEHHVRTSGLKSLQGCT